MNNNSLACTLYDKVSISRIGISNVFLKEPPITNYKNFIISPGYFKGIQSIAIAFGLFSGTDILNVLKRIDKYTRELFKENGSVSKILKQFAISKKINISIHGDSERYFKGSSDNITFNLFQMNGCFYYAIPSAYKPISLSQVS